MALPPIRGIAGLLQSMAKVGRGGRAGQLRRKPLLGKAQLDKRLTQQGNFAKEMRATSRPRFLKSSPIPSREGEYYGKAGPTGRRDMGWQRHHADKARDINPSGFRTSQLGPRITDEPSGLRATYEPSVGRFPTPAERRAGARGPSGRERREERTRMAKGMGVRRKEKYHPLLMESDPDFVQQVLAGDPDALARYLGRPPTSRG